jgi:hypothetical protein
MNIQPPFTIKGAPDVKMVHMDKFQRHLESCTLSPPRKKSGRRPKKQNRDLIKKKVEKPKVKPKIRQNRDLIKKRVQKPKVKPRVSQKHSIIYDPDNFTHAKMLSRKARSTTKNHKKVISVHHKTGVRLMRKIFRELNRKFGYKVKFCIWGKNEEIPRDNFVGIHMIRHPCEVITSGYLYHKSDCPEPWCNNVNKATGADGIKYNFDGKCYKEHLNNLTLEQGINTEMTGRSREAINDMYKWKFYNDKRMLNVRMEDIMHDFDGTITRILVHLGDSPNKVVKQYLPALKQFDLGRKSKKRLKEMSYITNVEQNPMRYKTLWNEANYAKFNQVFPKDLLTKLGYSL